MSENESNSIPQHHTSVLSIVLYVFWGFFSFLAGVYLFFPRDLLRMRLEQELSLERGAHSPPWATGYAVSVGELDVHLIHPGIHVGDIRLAAKPAPGKSEDGKKNSHDKALIIDSFDVYISWWDLLLGRIPPPSIQAEIKAFGGDLAFKLDKEDASTEGTSHTKDDNAVYRITLNANKLQFSQFSQVFFPTPTSGTLDLSADLVLPMDQKTKRMHFRELDGKVKVEIDGLAIGDGHTKLAFDSLPEMARPYAHSLLETFAPTGIPIPRLQFGTLNGTIRFQKEQALLEGWQFHNNSSSAPEAPQAQSVPMNLLIDGSLAISDNFEASTLNIYLRIGPWRKLFDRVIDRMKESFDSQKEAEKIKELEGQLRPLADLVQMQDRADGFLGFSVSGPLLKPAFVFQKNNPDRIILQSALK